MIGATIHFKIMEETTVGIIIGKIIVGVITGKKGIEVQVGTVTEITTETIQEKDMTKVEIQVEIGVEKDSEGHYLGWKQKVEGILIGQEQKQGLDQVQGSSQIEIGSDVIGAESMITFRESAPMLLQMRTQIVQNKPPYKCWLRTVKLTLTPMLQWISGMFKHVKGKNGTTSFLPLDSKKGGNVTLVKDVGCLTENQTKYIYKKAEQGSDLNTETMKQEIEQEKMTGTGSSREDKNLCQRVMLNDVYKQENEMAHTENWSILSDNIRYVNHDEGSKTTCKLDVETLNYWKHKRLYLNLKGEESQTIDLDFGSSLETIRSN